MVGMKNIIKNIAQQIADDKGFFLVNSITKGSNRKPIFEIYIDNKEGINANDCADFSRAVKEKIESSELADLDYSIVVSSPGTDEPIKYFDQYFKHISREFIISFDDGEKIQSIEAKLIRILEDDLIFKYKDEELVINFNKIKKAKVKISF
jgi:ribosome maturation factor RimP